jgi:hypothetical protein
MLSVNRILAILALLFFIASIFYGLVVAAVGGILLAIAVIV